MQENRKWIIHIDGDAFFASVEVSRRPDLFGKPVVVGEEKGIVTALSYPAKAMGIKRGDPIFKIKKDFPSVVILSSHFELYRKFANNFADILRPEVEDFEAYSIDECFATITGNILEVQDKVRKIKSLIQKKLGITYSFGVSTTKTLAKVASKRNKPDGICFLMTSVTISQALQNTKVGDIWGIGQATKEKLNKKGIVFASELVDIDMQDRINKEFTKPYFQTQEELSGIVHYTVGSENPHQKSIQSTRTFLDKIFSKNDLLGELSRNVEIACSELRFKKLVTNKVSFFLQPKNSGQDFIDFSINLPYFTDLDLSVMKYIEQSFDKSLFVGNIAYKKSGVTMLNLRSKDELEPDLFSEQETVSKEENKLSNLIDSIRFKHGFGMVCLATSLSANDKRRVDCARRHKEDNYISGLPFPFLGIIFESV